VARKHRGEMARLGVSADLDPAMGAFPGRPQYVRAGPAFGRIGAFGLRLKVWWSRRRLTRELAGGAAVVDSRQLALRAAQLTGRRTRETIACSIADLLDQAERGAPVLSSRVPVNRPRVRAVHDELLELVDRLRSGEGVRAQGVALALLLLTDPEGALHGDGTTEGALRQRLVEASRGLNLTGIDSRH
jgi:hypothetical protein